MRIPILNESQLFYFLKRSLFEDLTPTLGMVRYDAFSLDHNVEIELKCRKRHYDNLLIEHDKYVEMCRRSDLLLVIPLYISSTPRGIFLFEIGKANINWEYREMPATTEYADSCIRYKKVGYLNIFQSYDITYILNS